MEASTEFVTNFYDALANVLNMENTPSNLFFQMVWPGIAISSSDYMDDKGKPDPNLVEELFSSLSNIARILVKSKYENSGFKIEDIYDILISSARPNV